MWRGFPKLQWKKNEMEKSTQNAQQLFLLSDLKYISAFFHLSSFHHIFTTCLFVKSCRSLKWHQNFGECVCFNNLICYYIQDQYYPEMITGVLPLYIMLHNVGTYETLLCSGPTLVEWTPHWRQDIRVTAFRRRLSITLLVIYLGRLHFQFLMPSSSWTFWAWMHLL